MNLPREAAVYASGVLDDLPPGLNTPACFGIVQTQQWVGIFMEDLGDAPRHNWAPDAFERAAYEAGRLSGTRSHELLGAAMEGPRRTFIRQDESGVVALRRVSLISGDAANQAIPFDSVREMISAWADHSRLHLFMDRVPIFPCHGDYTRRNLCLRKDVVVAYDWANFGTGPCAMDLVTLIYYGLLYFDLTFDDMTQTEDRLIRAYQRGLFDSDVELSQLFIRSAYAVQFAAGVALLELHPLMSLLRDPHVQSSSESFYGQPLSLLLDRRRRLIEHAWKLWQECMLVIPQLSSELR